MLVHGTTHQPLFLRSLYKCREQFGLFVMMMLCNTVNPSDTVADKVRLVSCGLYARHLLVDAVEAAYESIVAQGHVGGLYSEGICLHVVRRTLRDLETTYAAGQVFRCVDNWKW